MNQEPTLDDARWPDGTVRVVDFAYPVDVTWDSENGSTVSKNVRVAVARMPDEGYAVYVFNKGVGDGPLLEMAGRLVEIQQIHPTGRTMVLVGGYVLQYWPASHCGCGDRLKSYRPWPGRVVADKKPALPWMSVTESQEGSDGAYSEEGAEELPQP